jgi:two-component system cell cycle response regulator
MEREVSRRVILIDANDATREVLAARLRSQGYDVEPVPDGATGADLALSAPPAAVISDLWLPSISGVQICRLLRSEAATAEVPVILRGERDDPRSRFWAERAGAVAYVVKGRMGDLVRALAKACASERSEGDGFFMQLSGGNMDIRDRIAQHLDAALFDSVIAAEVRALANAGEFPRLFDQLSQLMSQLSSYRWVALTSSSPEHFGLHCHPKLAAQAESEARAALGIGALPLLAVHDEDASCSADVNEPVVCAVRFANGVVGTIALGPTEDDQAGSADLMRLVARELGGALRMAALVEESQRQASIDMLTGLMTRRAFLPAIRNELARGKRYGHHLCVLLLDVDHFKQINDRFGHAAGDMVLSAVGKLLSTTQRGSDFTARWGGEEFVIALTNTDVEGGRVAAERARAAVEGLEIEDKGQRIPVTASVGLASLQPEESVEQLMDRADRAMYAAKYAGRNRVGLDEPAADSPRVLSQLPAKGPPGEWGTGSVPAIVVSGRDPRAS